MSWAGEGSGPALHTGLCLLAGIWQARNTPGFPAIVTKQVGHAVRIEVCYPADMLHHRDGVVFEELFSQVVNYAPVFRGQYAKSVDFGNQCGQVFTPEPRIPLKTVLVKLAIIQKRRVLYGGYCILQVMRDGSGLKCNGT